MPQTLLSSQLKALALAKGDDSKSKNDRPSILFDQSQAADISAHSILTVAQNALNELQEIDKAFESFGKTLFKNNSLKLDREYMPKEELTSLKASIKSFLLLLSSYLLLPPSQQTLEYLIRQYKIHIFDVDEIMMCILPYHETKLFVKIVRLLRIDSTKWYFLEKVKKKGSIIPRENLAERGKKDFTLIDFVCTMAEEMVMKVKKNHTSLSFTIILLLDTISISSKISDKLINTILPYIINSFQLESEELQAGYLMIITQLANRCTFSKPFLNSMLENLTLWKISNSNQSNMIMIQNKLMVILHIAQTQSFSKLPKKCFKQIIYLKNITEILFEFSNKYKIDQFMHLLLQGIFSSCKSLNRNGKTVFLFFQKLKMKKFISYLSKLIFEFYLKFGSDLEMFDENTQNMLSSIVKEIDQKFPIEFDNALNDFLKNHLNEISDEEKQNFFSFFKNILKESLHYPLENSNSTLYLSLEHPNANIRLDAVNQLSVMFSNSNSNLNSNKNSFEDAILRRLDDDDANIVLCILKNNLLLNSINEAFLLHKLKDILNKYFEIIQNSYSEDERKNAKIIFFQILEFFSSNFIQNHPQFKEIIFLILLSYNIAMPNTIEENLLAIKTCKKFDFFLFQNLNEADSLINSFDFNKDNNITNCVHLNEKILEIFSKNLCKNYKQFFEICNKNSKNTSKNLKTIIFFVIFKSLSFLNVKEFLEQINEIINFLQIEWKKIDIKHSFDHLNINYDTSTSHNFSSFYLEEDSKNKKIENYAILILQTLHVICFKFMKIENFESRKFSEQQKIFESEKFFAQLKNFFSIFFESSNSFLFEPHLKILMQNFTQPIKFCTFLSNLLVDLDVNYKIKLGSTKILSTYLYDISLSLKEKNNYNKYDQINLLLFQKFIFPLFVTLSHDQEEIRILSSNCIIEINYLQKMVHFEDESNSSDPSFLSHELFLKIFENFQKSKFLFSSDPNFLKNFFESIFFIKNNNEKTYKYSSTERKNFLNFLVLNVLNLNLYSQKIIFSFLSTCKQNFAILSMAQTCMDRILEKRKKYHLISHTDKIYVVDKVNEEELGLLIVLLKMFNSTVAKHLEAKATEKSLLKLLLESINVGDVDDDDNDDVVLQPIFVLSSLENDFYSNLNEDAKALIFNASLKLLGRKKNENFVLNSKKIINSLPVSSSLIVQYIESMIKIFTKKSFLENEKISKNKKIKLEKDENFEKNSKITINNFENVFFENDFFIFSNSFLEILLWKDDIKEKESFIPQLQTLLWVIFETFFPIEANFETYSKYNLNSKINYIIQLILNILIQISNKITQEKDALSFSKMFDIKLFIHCLLNSKEINIKNFCIQLITNLSKFLTKLVLEDILETISKNGKYLLTQEDNNSHRIFNQLLKSIIPNLINENYDITPLIKNIVNIISDIPFQFRSTLLSVILRSSTAEKSLHQICFFLFQKIKQNQNKIKQSQTQIQSQNQDKDESIHAIEENNWIINLCDNLFNEILPSTQIKCMIKLLKWSKNNIENIENMEKKENKLENDKEIDIENDKEKKIDDKRGGNRGGKRRDSFEKNETQVDSFVNSKSDAWFIERQIFYFLSLQLSKKCFFEKSIKSFGFKVKKEIHNGFTEILKQIFQRFKSKKEKKDKKDNEINEIKEINEYEKIEIEKIEKEKTHAFENAYSLLHVLNNIMSSLSFYNSLSDLMLVSDVNVQKRILKLVSSQLKVKEEKMRLNLSSSQKFKNEKKFKKINEEMSEEEIKKIKKFESTSYISIIKTICIMLSKKNKEKNVSLKLTALQTFLSLSETFSSYLTHEFVSTLPVLISNITSSATSLTTLSIRCVHSVINATQKLCIPNLKLFFPKLFQAAMAAASCLEASQVNKSQTSITVVPKSIVEQSEAENDAKMNDGYPNEEKMVVAKSLLLSFLECLDDMLATFDSFLSPYIPNILESLILKSKVFRLDTALAEKSKAVLRRLTEKIHIRLLLAPLLSCYDTCLLTDVSSTKTLLSLFSFLPSSLDKPSLSSYHSALFQFLLKPFDLRRKPPPSFLSSTQSHLLPSPSPSPSPFSTSASLSPAQEVEKEAVASMVELVMKLNEKTFKPLFIHLLDWVRKERIEEEKETEEMQEKGGSVQRNIVFYSFVYSLSEKLRSVFVPYFGFLMDDVISHFTSFHPAEASGKKTKKRKISKHASYEDADSAVLTSEKFHLCVVLVKVLNNLFLFDTVGFLDANVFQKLVEPLVSQIKTEIKDENKSDFAENGFLKGSLDRAAMDQALVSCLSQMAVAAKSDVLCKTLNHHVLMCTRSEKSRVKLISLEIISAIVEKVKEEYLILLPETIPFLAELLEDTDVKVVSEAQILVRALEEMSGEDLEQYF